MTEKTDKIQVQIKYKGAEQSFEGTAEDAWLILNKFFSQLVPSFKVAQALWLSVDMQALAKDCEGLIAFSAEGSNVLAPKNRLTDNETLALWLLASYLGHKLNLLQSDSLSKEELQAKLGKSGKITSTRLGELVKSDMVAKSEDDRFRMTTFGVAQMQKEILPRIRAKATSG
ncbi:MAG: hypothetical protein ACE14S_07475 [Candidatus Bathyarchaeia archaeon]